MRITASLIINPAVVLDAICALNALVCQRHQVRPFGRSNGPHDFEFPVSGWPYNK